MDGIATLIARTYKSDNIGQPVIDKEEKKDIFITEKSVNQREFMEAGKLGLTPEFVLITPRVNYQGESSVIYNGVEYGIYRTYHVRTNDEIELYLEKKAGVGE